MPRRFLGAEDHHSILWRRIKLRDPGCGVGSTHFLVGVMGAGLLVFVRNDLEAVVEVNQGQRPFNLADAGVQAARSELLSQPAAELYDGNSTDNSGWAYTRQSGASTKTLDMEEGTAAITIQYLSPSASE